MSPLNCNLPPLLTHPQAAAVRQQQSFAAKLHRYRGSLQLLPAENVAGTLSFPQILFPALWGWAKK